MEYTNGQMEQMLNQLNSVGDAKGILAYAITRNRRFLLDEAKEFIELRDKLVYELGEPIKDEFGKDTDEIGIKIDSPNFSKFTSTLDEYLGIVHEPKIYKVPASKVIDQMTADQMTNLEWMIDFDLDEKFEESSGSRGHCGAPTQDTVYVNGTPNSSIVQV